MTATSTPADTRTSDTRPDMERYTGSSLHDRLRPARTGTCPRCVPEGLYWHLPWNDDFGPIGD
jgi:hypothetical protein